MWNAAGELRALLDELAEIDWRHPAWWAVVASTAALERLPAPRDPDAGYITSNGGPRADTFMAREVATAGLVDAVASAVVRARAASDTLIELADSYPEQPLLRQLDVRGPVAHRRAADPRRVLFAMPTGLFAATLDDTGRGDAALAAELAAACAHAPASGSRLAPIDPLSGELPGACIAVSLYTEELSTARHLHRRTWTRAGGPWLGLGHTATLELVSTSHTIVDGYGHGEISQRVFGAAARARAMPPAVVAAIRRQVGDAVPVPGPTLAVAEPLGIATRVVEPARFAELTYATAATLERVYRRSWTDAQRRAARLTPTLQIPVAPGRRGDPGRLRRRVVPGLIAVRMSAGELEPFEAFRARLPGLLEREAALGGMLTRMRTAAVRAPVPRRWVRSWLARGAAPSRWLPPIDVLAGRGCVSYLRLLEAPAWPLYAVSAPGLDPGPGDARGSTVLTAVETDAGLALTISGTGLAGTAAGAERFGAAVASNLEGVVASRADGSRRGLG